MFQVMAGQGDAVPLAPRLKGPHPVLDPQLMHQVVQVEANPAVLS
jgi:hypothetical protein